MKSSYDEFSFKTLYAARKLREWLPEVDFALAKKYGDDEARQAVVQATIPFVNLETHEADTSKLPEIVDLGSNRLIDRETYQKLVTTFAYKRMLDAFYTFEKFFAENRTAEDALLALQGKKPSAQQPLVGFLLPMFPAEATYIRREFVTPVMRKNNELYNYILRAEADNLSDPISVQLASGPTILPPVGSAEGPRIPPLEPQEISMLLSLWAAGDQTITAMLKTIPDIKAFKAPRLNA